MVTSQHPGKGVEYPNDVPVVIEYLPSSAPCIQNSKQLLCPLTRDESRGEELKKQAQDCKDEGTCLFQTNTLDQPHEHTFELNDCNCSCLTNESTNMSKNLGPEMPRIGCPVGS